MQSSFVLSISYTMAEQFIPVAGLFLFLNTLMYAMVLGIGGWAMNRAIDHDYIIYLHGISATGQQLLKPRDDFSPIYFSMGNAATGFFVMFAMIAGAVGVASTISGINHLRRWNVNSLSVAASAASIAWTLTLLAMGLGCGEIELYHRNGRLRTMEDLIIVLSATQPFYIAAIHEAASKRRT